MGQEETNGTAAIDRHRCFRRQLVWHVRLGHFPADSAPPVNSSQVASARSTTGGTSWFKRYRCCTSFAAASVTRI